VFGHGKFLSGKGGEKGREEKKGGEKGRRKRRREAKENSKTKEPFATSSSTLSDETANEQKAQ